MIGSDGGCLVGRQRAEVRAVDDRLDEVLVEGGVAARVLRERREDARAPRLHEQLLPVDDDRLAAQQQPAGRGRELDVLRGLEERPAEAAGQRRAREDVGAAEARVVGAGDEHEARVPREQRRLGQQQRQPLEVTAERRRVRVRRGAGHRREVADEHEGEEGGEGDGGAARADLLRAPGRHTPARGIASSTAHPSTHTTTPQLFTDCGPWREADGRLIERLVKANTSAHVLDRLLFLHQ